MVNETEEAASPEGTDDLTVDFIFDKLEGLLRKRDILVGPRLEPPPLA